MTRRTVCAPARPHNPRRRARPPGTAHVARVPASTLAPPHPPEPRVGGRDRVREHPPEPYVGAAALTAASRYLRRSWLARSRCAPSAAPGRPTAPRAAVTRATRDSPGYGRRGGTASAHVRGLSPKTDGTPWLEGQLLDHLSGGHPVELRHCLRALLKPLAFEIGYVESDETSRLGWPGEPGVTPAAALRELLLGDPPPLLDPGPVTAALAAWRDRDPQRVGAVLDLVASLTAELEAPGPIEPGP